MNGLGGAAGHYATTAVSKGAGKGKLSLPVEQNCSLYPIG